MGLDTTLTDQREQGAPGDAPWALLSRHFAGQATADEMAALRQWVGTDLARQREVEFLRSVWSESAVVQAPDEPGDVERVLAALTLARQERTAHGARFRGRAPRWMVGSLFSRWELATVVAVILTVVALVGGWHSRYGAGTSPHGAVQSYTTYATTNGEQATITLPDGNTVMLDAASRLEVPTDYGTGHHVVRLTVGEALFSVTHHVGTPFTVVAGAVTTRVLGTSFVVRHYREDVGTTVAVKEGRVAVGSVIVVAHQSAEISERGVARVQAADESRFTFATGVLTLGVTPMSKAIPELNRWYGADVRLGDSALASREVEGRFIAGSLTDLAAILRLTLDVRVVRSGRVLTLYPENRR